MAGTRCTICAHEERALIDQQLARGNLSLRAMASHFKVGRNALARHQEAHLMKAVQQQIRRQQERGERELTNLWEERLHDTYAAARRGLERAERDDEKWGSSAIGFIGQLNKSVELGLKASGQIEGGRGDGVSIVQNVLIMPMAPAPTAPTELSVIDIKALPESEEDEPGAVGRFANLGRDGDRRARLQTRETKQHP